MAENLRQQRQEVDAELIMLECQVVDNLMLIRRLKRELAEVAALLGRRK
jgi:hypothetical protein